MADQLVEHNQAEATQYLEQLRSRLDANVESRVLVSEHISATLHEWVEQERPDLVLLSAHGRSGQDRGLFGDVVTSFIAYGTTPLIIKLDGSQSQSPPTPIDAANGDSGGL